MNYTWMPATGADVQDIVSMAEANFQTEIDTIFTPEPIAYARNVMLSVVSQFYLPTTEFLYIARENLTNKLLCYTWAKSRDYAAWSDDQMVAIRMVHLDLNLSARLRVKLIVEMMNMWEQFAQAAGAPIICSNTMRHDQTAFLKLHARMGYDVRGSYAYKRLPSRDSLQS